MPATPPRILVPLAHRVAVPQLTRAAARVAELTGGELVLLHVVAVPMTGSLDESERAAEAEPLFALARACLPPDARVRAEVRLAHLVGDRIRQAAIELKADLVVVGWREAFSLKSLVQGTLQPLLERPPCDVLLADLDEAGFLDGVVRLPGTQAREAGARILAAAARTRASAILLHEREPKTRAHHLRMEARAASLDAFLRREAPDVDLRRVVDASRKPLFALAEAVHAVLILVAPLREAPRVQPRPLARIERPVVAFVG